MPWAKLHTIIELFELRGAIRSLFSWPKFSLAAFKICSRLRAMGVAPGTVIDVGANVGQFAVAASRLFDGAAIYSIEPDPNTAEALKKNTEKEERVDISICALGDSVGHATFYVNRDSQVSSLLPLGDDRINAFPDSTVAGEIKVPVTTLDVCFLDRALAHPILLKVDVQGFEDRVIRGGGEFLKTVEWILMEVSFARLYKGERDFVSLQDLLRRHGFEFLRPLNFHLSPLSGEIIEMDALFVRSPEVHTPG